MKQNISENNNIHYATSAIAQWLNEYLRNHAFDLHGCDSTSVIDFLYTAYTDNLEQDPADIQERFEKLGGRLEQLPLKENDAIFSLTCELCGAYEKRAFKDALQIGAYLMLELHAHKTTATSNCEGNERK